jgi:hypothetical protein
MYGRGIGQFALSPAGHTEEDSSSTSEDDLAVLSSHLLLTVGTAIADAITGAVCADANPPVLYTSEQSHVPVNGGETAGDNTTPQNNSSSSSIQLHPRVISDAQRERLRVELPSGVGASLVKLWTLAIAGRRSYDDFLSQLDGDVTEHCLQHMAPLRRPDKKRERRLVFDHRRALLTELESCATVGATEVMRLTLSLAFQQETGAPLALPPGGGGGGVEAYGSDEDELEGIEACLRRLENNVPVGVRVSLHSFLAAIKDGKVLQEEALAADDREGSERVAPALARLDSAAAARIEELTATVRAIGLAKNISELD